MAQVLLWASNLFILGSDLVMFSSVNDGRFSLAMNFKQSDPILSGYLLIGPAWTLGVELWFYLLAPFIHKSLKSLVILLVLSTGARLIAMKLGWGNLDPWSYRFFPFELSLFILGMLSHKTLYARYQFFHRKDVAVVSFVICLACVLSYGSLGGSKDQQLLLLFVPILLTLPGLFSFQNFFKRDRWIGELSYPIYLCHMLVIANLENRYLEITNLDGPVKYLTVSLASIVFAIVLKLTVIDSVEGFRKKIKTRQQLAA